MKKILFTLIALFGITATVMADSLPAYPGGEEALQNYLTTNMKYPATACDNGIEGVVNLECTIRTDGTVGPIRIVRMIDPDLEQEAIRLVKEMPAWTPAEKGGEPVETTVTIPVSFVLPE